MIVGIESFGGFARTLTEVTVQTQKVWHFFSLFQFFNTWQHCVLEKGGRLDFARLCTYTASHSIPRVQVGTLGNGTPSRVTDSVDDRSTVTRRRRNANRKIVSEVADDDATENSHGTLGGEGGEEDPSSWQMALAYSTWMGERAGNFLSWIIASSSFFRRGKR